MEDNYYKKSDKEMDDKDSLGSDKHREELHKLFIKQIMEKPLKLMQNHLSALLVLVQHTRRFRH